MGVPAFYRWLSEKYPKIVQDVIEERVALVPGSTSIRLPFDSSLPNPNHIEYDHLYIDMNGIIHPCSHPEIGPQPTCEEEMYMNVCMYIERLIRLFRPRQLLYLAIDGVAPRAKMNQQRSRRFRSAQEARELQLLEQQVRIDIQNEEQQQQDGGGGQESKELSTQFKKRAATTAWDSNVITPGTPFMINLATYIRYYIRKRISEDPKMWGSIRIIFSDASIPGEGEHKIMNHIRLQRSGSNTQYNPNIKHVLHGLDADLIMLALATHEIQFYIAREEVIFGRQSIEQKEERQIQSGFRDAQRLYDEKVGMDAMSIIENNQKPIQCISIPILREYLYNEFYNCCHPTTTYIHFIPNFERLIDDIVFLCFFVGNDFLPHLPSLDIRDGALDFLFNVYKQKLPTFSDYITKSGGIVNLSYVDIILAEVGNIEDYVFTMKYENEQREQQKREEMKLRNKQLKNHKNAGPPSLPPPPPPGSSNNTNNTKVVGRAARILAKQQQQQSSNDKDHSNSTSNNTDMIALTSKKHPKSKTTTTIQATPMKSEQNMAAAMALKEALISGTTKTKPTESGDNDVVPGDEEDINNSKNNIEVTTTSGIKRKSAEITIDTTVEESKSKSDLEEPPSTEIVSTKSTGNSDPNFQFDPDDNEDDEAEKDDIEEVIDEVVDPEIARLFKERVKKEQQAKLDEHVKSVEDKVRLHEPGWKDRYYSDKCKADDVANHGGREHLFRSYVMGLCWVMKYYYDGCPSWKWYYPFHYAPFASDLKNIERFELDCKSFELDAPFNPVEQLMAVLPSDSSHAIPKESRWLMEDPESPIIDFYPSEVPVDPNGKAMPWLWVVLLPFIDEERLLAAMAPTMTKWDKKELLCNARGLDDGYLFVHKKHPLTKKISAVLQQSANGKINYSLKVKLNDSAAYGCAGFSGSIRAPLSNEIYPIDEESVVLSPPGADKINRSGGEYNIFSDNIDPNDAVCVAFTEPPKLSHRSIILPGAIIPEPILTDDDKRIRRPKLNRGGGSIAHMGMSSNGPNHNNQQGYGTMYDRNRAQLNGRGNVMNQAGNRSWGSMEPHSKRPYNNALPPPPPPPHPQQQLQMPNIMNPFMNHGSTQNHSTYPPNQWQMNQRGGPYTNVPPPPPPPQQHQYQHRPPAPQYIPGYPNNQYHQLPYQTQGPQGQQQYQTQGQQGFNFRSYNNNNNNGVGSGNPYIQQQQQQQPNTERRSRASADVMNSLRAQLSNTLNQKKNGNNHPK